MSAAFKGTIMRSDGYSSLIPHLLVLVIVVFACAAGCSTPQASATATSAPAPVATAASSSGVIATTAVAKTADIDTSISVSFDDYACLDVQKEMGVPYLYPDQKYTLSATSPGSINVNILFLDTNDNLKFRETEPAWDSVTKKWEYAGLVPLAKFDDVNGPVQKTFTIKEQGKYYICIDDRKETGVNTAVFHVPVKLLKLS
jgi:hypothetical protein